MFEKGEKVIHTDPDGYRENAVILEKQDNGDYLIMTLFDDGEEDVDIITPEYTLEKKKSS